MTWNLSAIQQKVRNITGSPSQDQLSDSDLNNYINNYYVYTMPFELKEQITLDFLDFYTVPGQDVYPFPGAFLTDQPMVYINGFPGIFYESADIFFQDWPQQYTTDFLANGDGITNSFTGSLQGFPVIQGSLFITDGTQILTSQVDGTFTGSGTGTIDYFTGNFTVNFTLPPASGATIYGTYEGYQPTRPQGMLFFNNQFTFRPIPDQVYAIRMQGYINPPSLTDPNNSVPLQPEWGPTIAYGASVEIFNDRGDKEKADEAMVNLKRWEVVALARSTQQYEAQQSVPRF